jgi:hypothetical protein
MAKSSHRTIVRHGYTRKDGQKVYWVNVPKWMRRKYGRVIKNYGYTEGRYPVLGIICEADEKITRDSALNTFRVGQRENLYEA